MLRIRLTVIIFTCRRAVVAEYFWFLLNRTQKAHSDLSKDNFATRKMAIQRIRCRKTLIWRNQRD